MRDERGDADALRAKNVAHASDTEAIGACFRFRDQPSRPVVLRGHVELGPDELRGDVRVGGVDPGVEHRHGDGRSVDLGPELADPDLVEVPPVLKL